MQKWGQNFVGELHTGSWGRLFEEMHHNERGYGEFTHIAILPESDRPKHALACYIRSGRHDVVADHPMPYVPERIPRTPKRRATFLARLQARLTEAHAKSNRVSMQYWNVSFYEHGVQGTGRLAIIFHHYDRGY